MFEAIQPEKTRSELREPTMTNLLRLLMALVTGFVLYFFAFWISAGLLPDESPLWINNAIAMICAAAAAWIVWSNKSAKGGGTLSRIATHALVGGAIGFAAGFFGPLIFTPESNQGPLLGILFTGPLGVLLGVLSGLFAGWRKRSVGGGSLI